LQFEFLGRRGKADFDFLEGGRNFKIRWLRIILEYVRACLNRFLAK